MQRFRSNFINGVHNLFFNHGLRQIALYSTSNSTKVNPNFVNYLVQTLGLSQQQALSTYSNLVLQRLYYGQRAQDITDDRLIEKANSVITYFKEIGLHQSHIQNAVIVHPVILLYNVRKTLNPTLKIFLKLGFFKPDVAEAIRANSEYINSKQTLSTSYKRLNPGAKNANIATNDVDKTLTPNPNNDALLKLGFSDSDIAALVSANPSLDLADLYTTVVAAIQALKEIMGCEGCQLEGCLVIPILNKLSRNNHSLYDVTNCMVPNVAFLQSCGVPIDAIRHHLPKKPYGFVSDTGSFQNTVARVEEVLGVPPSTPGFLVGVEVFPYYDNEVIKSKMQIYRSYGWTDSDIVTHLLSSYEILRMSEDNKRKKLDFLMNDLGYDPTYLAPKCNLFTSSLEKKLVPRLKVLEVLKENGLISEDYDLWAVVKYTNSQFLNVFVLPYKEVHEIYSEHAGMSLEMRGSLKPNSNAV